MSASSALPGDTSTHSHGGGEKKKIIFWKDGCGHFFLDVASWSQEDLGHFKMAADTAVW